MRWHWWRRKKFEDPRWSDPIRRIRDEAASRMLNGDFAGALAVQWAQWPDLRKLDEGEMNLPGSSFIGFNFQGSPTYHNDSNIHHGRHQSAAPQPPLLRSFEGVDLRGSRLTWCDFETFCLRAANFAGSTIRCCSFRSNKPQDCSDVSFAGAELDRVGFTNLKMQWGNFDQATVRWMSLTYLDLRNSSWAQAGVSPDKGRSSHGLIVDGCDLSGADLSSLQFEAGSVLLRDRIFWSPSTKWPSPAIATQVRKASKVWTGGSLVSSFRAREPAPLQYVTTGSIELGVD